MPRNVRLPLVVIFGLVATMVSLAFAGDPVTPPRTQIRLLTPFGTKGLSDGIQIADKATGKCFAPSAALPRRPDAWRCSAGNAILDPCFQQIMGNEKEFACAVEGPWARKVIVLTITEPIPTEPRKELSRDTTLPWAIELASGQHCSLFTGATAPVAGMRINYGCPGGYQVVGDIDRTAPLWRVFVQAENASVLEQVDVTVAWY